MPDKSDSKVIRSKTAAGHELVRPEEDVRALADLGERPATPSETSAQATKANIKRRKEAFDNFGDKALTFAGGLVDAMFLGFLPADRVLHETREAAAIAKDVNSGSALTGELTGFAIGMAMGPEAWAAQTGRMAGKLAAKTVLREASEKSIGKLAVKTAEGAGEMAAIMGGAAVGHQVVDAVLDDKPFSAAAVVHEAGLGAILGGGFHFLSGVFGKAASRYEVKAQGGLLDATSDASRGLSDHVSAAARSWDEALVVHEQRLGVLKQLEAEGLLDAGIPEFMAKRELAVAEARGAQKNLAGLDFDRALNGSPQEWSRYHKALERYEEKLAALDDMMTPRNLERVRPGELGTAERVAGPMEPGKSPTLVFAERGGVDRAAYELDDLMRSDPRRLAEYERLQGRPYEFMPALEKAAAPLEKGVATETSELMTRPGTPRRGVAPAETPAPVAASEPMVPSGPWTPSSPPGRFSMSEFSPNTLAGEGIGAKPVGNTLAKLPDGYFIPAADVRQTAEAFANFRGRMAQESVVPVARPSAGTPLPPSLTPAVKQETTKVIGRGSAEPTKVIPREPRAEPREAPPVARVGSVTEKIQHSEGKKAVRRYLDEWYATADALGPKQSPGDRAAEHIRRTLKELNVGAQGRDISASATDLGRHLRLPEARTAFGAELNSLYAMRQLANVAADASKGSLRAGSQRGARNKVLEWITRRAMGKVGASVLGGAVGHSVGGPLGYFAGAALAYKYVGFGGRAAGASGRLYQKTVKAANTLLAGKRASFAARAVAGNRPVAYSDRGPIKDPVERIEELRRVASSPATMADYVSKASGDLNVVAPQFVEAAVAHVTAQMQFLVSMAPPVRYDALGKPMQPSAGELRRFLEAENAVFNLDAVLDAVGKGRVTRVQVEALRQAHAPVYTKIAAFLLEDPEKLSQLERAKLRTIEMVTGMPLTPGADPEYIARQQMIWAPMPTSAGGPGGTPGTPGKPQALKISGAGPAPSDTPAAKATPAQSYGVSGRAPGN